VRSRWRTFKSRFNREYTDYGPSDPRWALLTGLAVARRQRDREWRTRTFNAVPATADLGERVRLFIFGDWATGIDRAQRVAGAIRLKLGEQESVERDCHVIHLGDTYFSGYWYEQLKNVLWHWPVRGGANVKSWALPGNHDYYSGLQGFFEGLLRDRRFRNQYGPAAPTSIFDLSNAEWRVIGLDTSWIDHDLPEEEERWLSETLNSAWERKQSVILLSHHQPWSSFGHGPNPRIWQRGMAIWSQITGRSGRRLWKKIYPLLKGRPIEAWFWGHEHRLALYEPTKQIMRPRLIGNGGVPTEVTDASYVDRPEFVELDYQDPLPYDTHWCQFAFAVVDLDPGGGLTEMYFNEFGDLIAKKP
jgi:Calcineurin-like phosphoesterase